MDEGRSVNKRLYVRVILRIREHLITNVVRIVVVAVSCFIALLPIINGAQVASAQSRPLSPMPTSPSHSGPTFNDQLPQGQLAPRTMPTMQSRQTTQNLSVTHQVNVPTTGREIPVSTHPDARPVEPGLSSSDPLSQKIEFTDEETSESMLDTISGSQSGKSILKVVGGLSLVIAIFYGFAVFARRNGARINSRLPGTVLEVLGAMPIDGKRNLQLVRLGGKILLLCVSSTQVETVGEVSDPVEVDHMMSMLQQGRSAEPFLSFKRVLNQSRHQRRAQRYFQTGNHPEIEDDAPESRGISHNVFEA